MCRRCFACWRRAVWSTSWPRDGAGEKRPGPSGGEGQWQWTSESYPADAVSLRAISSDNFVVVDTTRGSDVIGETSFTSGPATLHEKAIYMVEGTLYQVERLDFVGRKAFVRRIDCDYYTDAITYTKVTVLETFAGGSAARNPPYAPHPNADAVCGSEVT